jgi:hypothetical protein
MRRALAGGRVGDIHAMLTGLRRRLEPLGCGLALDSLNRLENALNRRRLDRAAGIVEEFEYQATLICNLVCDHIGSLDNDRKS